MSAHQMGSAGPETKLAHRFGRDFGDARIRRQSQIIVTAKGQIFPAIDPDLRALRGVEQATVPAQPLLFQIGKFGNKVAHCRIGSPFDDRTKHRIPSAGARAFVAAFHWLDAKFVEQHSIAIGHGIGRGQQLFAVEDRIGAG